MKKAISIILSISLVIAVFIPCFSFIQMKIEQSNAINVNKQVVQMSMKYDKEYESRLNNTDVQSIKIDKRIIVKTASKINIYDAVDVTYGLGYAFVQFDNAESAEKALNQYNEQGLNCDYDHMISLNDVSTTAITTSYNKWAYDAVEAQNAIDYFSKSTYEDITVLVLDTGINYNHEEFKNRLIRTNINFSTTGNENDELDDYGHGTACSSIIKMSTPSNVMIENIKIGSAQGNFNDSQLITALAYIKNMSDKPDIINMSFGKLGNNLYADEIDELKKENIVCVASAGNENMYAKNSSPASCNSTITVSASNTENRKCDFSNYGDIVDMSAPGTDVYVAYYEGGYKDTFSGTSASAPFVCAAASYVLMQNNSLNFDEVKEKLQKACIPIQETNSKKWSGAGLINFYNLIENEEYVSPVSFNYEIGDYTEDISLEMNCPDSNTKIYYTTDNTIPSKTNGTEYTKPITISKFTRIIAVAYDNTYKVITSKNKHHSTYNTCEFRIIKNASESDFEINEKGVITAYNGSNMAIVVPETINGITPTEIGEGCFENSEIIYVELPDSITLLGKNAFENSKIEYISAKGVNSIGSYCFSYCTNLAYEYLPDAKRIYDYAFQSCGLLTDFSFRESVESLSFGCLRNTGLSSAEFPNVISQESAFDSTPITKASLPKIKNLIGGFNNCYYLSEVEIPNVFWIEDAPFAHCYSLTEQLDFSKIEYVWNDGFMNSCFDKIDLPNCIQVADGAFYNSRAVTINLPACKSVCSSFGENLFIDGMSPLQNVYMPNVETITAGTSSRVFINCFELKGIYLPKVDELPTFEVTERGMKIYNTEPKTEAKLEYIYTPRATKLNSYYCDLSVFENLKFVYAPNLTYLDFNVTFPSNDGCTFFFSSKLTEFSVHKDARYNIIAESGSVAEKWATTTDYSYQIMSNFIPSESISCNGFDDNDFIYVSTNGDEIRFPIWLVENMWHDYLPINEHPDYMTHGYIFDVVNDDFINAKDFAKIHHLSKYGW